MKDLAGRVFEGADVIDSRDVIERIEELEGDRDADPEAFSEDDAAELALLEVLASYLRRMGRVRRTGSTGRP